MDENSVFKNEDAPIENNITQENRNAQADVFTPNAENTIPSTEPDTINKNYTQTDNELEDSEIELDPELTDSNTNGAYAYSNQFGNEAENVMENNNPASIQPTPPIMPQIEKKEYVPIGNSKAGKGIKVFAIITALMFVLSACVTGGYFLGKSSESSNNKQPVVDLASKPESEDAMTVSQIYESISPSVVGIYVYNSEDGISATATGVIYSKDGYIITNDHIYEGVAAAKFKIYTHDKKMYSADYVAGDTRSDLAVLKISDAKNVDFIPAKLGNSAEAVVGESVVAIGRPNGATSPSIASEGIISVCSTRVSTTSSYTSSLIQTDSAINPGSSGGALCNIYGQVIGITSAKLVGSEYDGVGYAIPTVTVKKVVDSLIKHKKVKGRARLGISYLHIDELTAELLNLPCGLQIEVIDNSSDLYGKSVEKKDIITHINGTEITDSNIILDLIDASSPGDTLNLKIYSVKNKKYFDVTVKLLEDEGSSSYSSKKQQENDEQEYNSSEFNFPNGE